MVLQLCNKSVQNLLDIHAEYSNIHLIVYCKLVTSVCNIHMMTLLVSQIFIVIGT